MNSGKSVVERMENCGRISAMKTAFLLMALWPVGFLVAEEKEAAKESLPEQKVQAEVVGHPFSWPFVGWETMKPYGGTTKASRTELDESVKPEFTAIYEKGLSKKERDRRAILALAGDHRVSFDFIETASTAEAYLPPRPYFSWATERAFVIAERPNFISLQHILVMEFVDQEGQVQGPFVMKHWRQDWSYEDRSIVEYRGENTWQKRQLPKRKGTWIQAVYQVDDSPRYQTVGRWSHSGGMSIFRSENFWRPLPRREFSVRDDYNTLGGMHEITVTPTGWLHTQLNEKLVTKGGRLQRRIATELGAVRYERISTPVLDDAEDYWADTAEFWGSIRRTWAAVEGTPEPFTIRSKVDEKPMFSYLFELAGKLEGQSDADEQGTIIEGIATVGRFLAKEAPSGGGY